MRLKDDEIRGLCEIARKTKCDCWFDIRTDKNGNDYVFDLEAGKRIGFKTGVSQLAEAMIDPLTEYGLKDAEVQAVEALLDNLGIIPEFKCFGGENK